MTLPSALAGSRLLVKDETQHPSQSHKHRLAEALFVNALANGWLHSDSPVVEASSGSTAISEAWFAQKLGLEFIAVVPAGTARKKIEDIKQLGGTVIEAPGKDISATARQVARQRGGHFMDQFTYAERAYDWRSEQGIAAEIVRAADPDWFVMGAGTGGTVTSVARYARYSGHRVRVCVTDPENSAFFPGWRANDRTATGAGSRIEGIGRPTVEPSFLFPLVNRMMQVPDPASIGTMRATAQLLGVQPGASTGTGMYGALRLLHRLHEQGQTATVVTTMCDPGERYTDTYYNDAWLEAKGIHHQPWTETVHTFLDTGSWQPPQTWTAPPAPRAVLWNM